MLPPPQGPSQSQEEKGSGVQSGLRNITFHTSWVYDLEKVIPPEEHVFLFVRGREAPRAISLAWGVLFHHEGTHRRYI